MTKKLCLLLLCSVLGNLAAAADEEDPQSSVTAAPAGGEEATLADVLEGASGVRVATMCTNCNVAAVTMLGQSDDRVQVRQDGLTVVAVTGLYFVVDDAKTALHKLRISTYGRGTWVRDVVAPPVVYVNKSYRGRRTDPTSTRTTRWRRPWLLRRRARSWPCAATPTTSRRSSPFR